MYIGVAAPITGAASSIGVQQLHWAQFAVTQWNKSSRSRSSRSSRATRSSRTSPRRSRRRRRSRRTSASGWSPDRPAARRSRTRTRRTRAAGLAFISGSATRTSLTDGTPEGLLLPRRAERRRPGPDGRQVHRQQAAGEEGRTSSTTRRRTPRVSPTRCRAYLKAKGVDGRPRLDQPDRRRTSRRRSRRSRRHRRSSTSRGSCRPRRRRSGSS